MTLTNLSKVEILKEKAILDGIDSKITWFVSGGFWSKKEGAFRAARFRKEQGGNNLVTRRNLNDSILFDPRNITRWELEMIDKDRILQIQLDEEERILQIQLEKQRIENQKSKIIPEIIPAVVATSSLIPLGIIAILLLNSSRGKK